MVQSSVSCTYSEFTIMMYCFDVLFCHLFLVVYFTCDVLKCFSDISLLSYMLHFTAVTYRQGVMTYFVRNNQIIIPTVNSESLPLLKPVAAAHCDQLDRT